MKCYFILITAVFISLVSEGQTSITKIFITRHADRQGQEDELSDSGIARANELKRILGTARIDSIFSTNLTRAKKTAKPLAILRGLPIIPYSTEQEVINRIKLKNTGKRILIIGHSNTVSTLIRLCGCQPPASIVPNIPDSQFDNLFLVILQKSTNPLLPKCQLIHMKYGAITN